MFDLKVINSVLGELEETRGIPRARVLEAIEAALATAYRKEFGKRGQVVRAKFDITSGKVDFFQVKTVVDDTRVVMDEDELAEERVNNPESSRLLFNNESHILIEDARLIKKDAQVDDEVVFPLEGKDDFGRIASQTAKQVIMQKIREAEKTSVVGEFGKREGQIVTGTVQRIERGNIFVDLGRATGLLSYDERIPGEHFTQGERVRAYLYKVEESPRGVFLRLSRAHPKFVEELFRLESPEVTNGTVQIKAVAREAGSRTKIATFSDDSHIDPVGSMVGQRGVRVSTVMSELGGEKIDIIEWSADPKSFIEDALSPAKVMSVVIDEASMQATVEVSEDQQSLAIGRGGQNVRLAAKLTGWKIDIKSMRGEELAHAETATPKSEPVEETKAQEEIEVPAEVIAETPVEAAPEETTEIKPE
ncbi:MAG: transcription termination factor NusA [Minisyncoccia bacterium]